MTSEPAPSGGDRRAGPGSISSAAGFPASRSVVPACDEGSPTSGGAGRGWPPSFAHFDPDSRSWRTSQLSFETLMPSASCSPIWPRSGMTRSGTAYRRPPSAPLTSETGSFSLLPTPRSAASRTSRRAATARQSRSAPSLDQAVELMAGVLPRELTSLDEAPASWRRWWPTPVARDGGRGGMSSAARARWLATSGKTGLSLSDEVGGPTNPTFVEWLMGFPAGWTDVEPSATP